MKNKQKKNFYAEHQRLINRILPELQQVFPHGRFFARHVGLFYTKYGKPVKINKPGMSDVWAIFKTSCGALYLEYEFKTGEASKSKAQLGWGEFLGGMESKSILVREDNLEQVILETKKALAKCESLKKSELK